MDINAPKAGGVHVVAQANALVTGDTTARFDLQLRDVQGNVYSPFAVSTLQGPSAYGTNTVSYVFPVVPGAHRYELIAGWYFFQGTQSAPLFRNPVINAFFMPFPAQGTITTVSSARLATRPILRGERQ